MSGRTYSVNISCRKTLMQDEIYVQENFKGADSFTPKMWTDTRRIMKYNPPYGRKNIEQMRINAGKEQSEMVIKKEEAKKRTFKGVSLDSLAVGEKSMVAKMNYVEGNYATLHTHPHEQSGYVISGRYLMTVDGEEYELHPGDSYAIPGNTPHSFRVIEGGEVIDVFTPVREDYL